eukprot:GHVL01035040.1.p1 GENE.GHVL01035040.1~~GHVL01035040.1.p1  ORF type:complete len:915 (+),score=215.24 GHVL01035040.1:790-3534(+)
MGFIRVFEKDSKELFKKSWEQQIEPESTVIGLSVSTSKDFLCISMSSSQIYKINLSSTDLFKSEGTAAFHLITTGGFHTGNIRGMDVCANKPLIATVGEDRTLRIWNYLEKTCELVKTWQNEDIFSVAIDPSGLFLLIGFSDKLRFLHILSDNLKIFKEFPIRACREVRFSNGGHMFAAVSGNTIQVYLCVTLDLLCNMRGHHQRIRSLAWSNDDAFLVSAGMDGAVYHFSVLEDGKRIRDDVRKGVQYTSVLMYSDPVTSLHRSIVVGSDLVVRDIGADLSICAVTPNVTDNETAVSTVTNVSVETHVTSDRLLGQIAIDSSCKFVVATDMQGPLRIYPFPLSDNYQSYPAHYKGCTRVVMSKDDEFIFTAGEDGCLCMFEVHDKTNIKKQKEVIMPMADVSLVTRAHLEEASSKIEDMQRELEETQNQNEFHKRNLQSSHKELIAEMNQSFEQKLKEEKELYSELQSDKLISEERLQAMLEDVKNENKVKFEELEAAHHKRLTAQYKRNSQLKEELAEEHNKYEKLIEEMKEVSQSKISELEESLEKEKALHIAEVGELRKVYNDLLRTHEETLKQTDEDAEKELEDVRETYDSKLTEQDEANWQLRGQTGMLKKNYTELKTLNEKLKISLKSQQEQNECSLKEVEVAKQNEQNSKNENSEKLRILSEKDDVIQKIKKQNQELQKLKSVLEFKMKTIQDEMEPKNEEMAKMKIKLEEMGVELAEFHKKNKQLGVEALQCTDKQRAMQMEMSNQKSLILKSTCMHKSIVGDIAQLAECYQDPKLLKSSVNSLYQKYCGEKADVIEKISGADIDKEHVQQRMYLEKTVEGLRKKLAKDSEVHKQDYMKAVQENVCLIQEINQLRKEVGFCRTQPITKIERSSSKGKRSSEGSSESKLPPLTKDPLQPLSNYSNG